MDEKGFAVQDEDPEEEEDMQRRRRNSSDCDEKTELMDEGSASPSRQVKGKSFLGWLIVAQSLGTLVIVFAIVWLTKYLNGFGLTDPHMLFNYHPFFMVFGFIFIYGNGILVYRVLPKERKTKLKILHALLNGTSLLLSILAVFAVFSFHNQTNKPNMYSLHSWLGLGTVILFASQYIFGFVAFLFPGINQTYRKLMMPYHVRFGLLIFVLAVICCLTGITEKALWSLEKDYAKLPPVAWLINLLGIAILFFAIVVVYLVTEPSFKRQPLAEEQTLQIPMEDTSSIHSY